MFRRKDRKKHDVPKTGIEWPPRDYSSDLLREEIAHVRERMSPDQLGFVSFAKASVSDTFRRAGLDITSRRETAALVIGGLIALENEVTDAMRSVRFDSIATQMLEGIIPPAASLTVAYVVAMAEIWEDAQQGASGT